MVAMDFSPWNPANPNSCVASPDDYQAPLDVPVIGGGLGSQTRVWHRRMKSRQKVCYWLPIVKRTMAGLQGFLVRITDDPDKPQRPLPFGKHNQALGHRFHK